MRMEKSNTQNSDLEKTVYLVIRNEDCLGPTDHGICESNSLIGIFTDQHVAYSVKANAEAVEMENDYEDEYYRRKTTICIIEVEANKIYDIKSEIYLSSACYIA